VSELVDEYPSYPYARTCPYDPPPEFARWRERSPLGKVRLWNGRDAWIVTGLDEVRAVLRDHETFSSAPTTPGFPSLSAADEATKASGLMQVTDPPVHEVLRRAVQREFTVRRVTEKRVQTAALAADLLDEMAQQGPSADLVEAFAAPVPAQFTCRLLGVPLEDARFFADCLGQRFDPTSEQASVYAADDRLSDYFAGVVDDRRARPRDDLSGRLVRDHVETGRLTPEQAASVLHVLLIGGFDTTRNMIAMGTLLLLDHPDELSRLRAAPDDWPPAIEEMLRYLSVVQYERRAVTRDTTIAGQPIGAGEGVLTLLHAANRDPRAFAQPDELDLDRNQNTHVAFGSGIHQCLGQPVARMMLHVTFPRLFDRFPGLRLAAPKDELVYNEGRTIWGPRELPVEW
jgi:cytochrome P450